MANVKGIHRYCSLSKFDASILLYETKVYLYRFLRPNCTTTKERPEIPHMLGTYQLLII